MPSESLIGDVRHSNSLKQASQLQAMEVAYDIRDKTERSGHVLKNDAAAELRAR
jgi:hypothetical protein